MGVRYRHANQDDIPEVASVFASAIDDLNRRHGFYNEPTSISPANPQYSFWLEKNPEAFWVAEYGVGLVGYAFSFVRGSLWFLADLFVAPASQGKGIGKALIERTLGSWKSRRITNRALITPAFNRTSVSLYMRFGMLPRQAVYFASAPRRNVAQALGVSGRGALETEELDDLSGVSSELDGIHKTALGFEPGWHNEYFSRVQRATCLLFKKRGRLLGYGFIRRNGRIGPLVMTTPKYFRDAFEATLRLGAEGRSKDLIIFFGGTNDEAVRMSIKYGFTIDYPLLFLSEEPMGDWRNYLPYSPGLM